MAANNVSSNGNAKGFFEAKPTVNSPTILQRLRFLISEMGWTSPALLGDGRELHDDPKTSGIIEDLKSQGSRIPENLDLLMDIIAGFSRGGLIDDREYTV